MEPEDYNGSVLTYTGEIIAGDSISTTLSWNPTKLIDTMRYNSDASLQIPIAFEKVLKKSIDGLVNVRIIGYETNSIVNPMKWETESQFLTHIELTFKYESSLKLPKEDYTEKINFAFKMAYPDMESVKFSVKNIIVENKDFHREFLEFFSR